jgi:hypothetical protein
LSSSQQSCLPKPLVEITELLQGKENKMCLRARCYAKKSPSKGLSFFYLFLGCFFSTSSGAIFIYINYYLFLEIPYATPNPLLPTVNVTYTF